MSDIAIKVENLSKKYIIGHGQSGSLRETLSNTWHNTFGGKRSDEEVFWALQDINFEIKQGEAVGIIGRNGAGKSTLLKLLSKITYPTTGKITMNGRVSSLLEVGTGFHPELTGRENIYLNGTILGMSRREVKSKFDEIVAFSGVEKFLDTPVKRYSSGMYVRLAFAVAAHLEPEILIIDEVLAVGDAEFQKKCLGKMGEVAQEGRTVLFVSHNMEAVQNLCTKAIMLEDGKISQDGCTTDVVNYYLNSNIDHIGSRKWNKENAPSSESIKLLEIKVSAFNIGEIITVDTGVLLEFWFESVQSKLNLGITIYLTNEKGVLLFESGAVITCNKDSKEGVYYSKVEIPAHLLNSGYYFCKLVIGESQRYILAAFDNILKFEVHHTSTGRDNNFSPAPGVIRPLLNWQSKFIEHA